ncbi:Alpha/beta hydrolase fold-1 [Cynara cardunculus var. scolymus]|uniref:Alpha/beta hydrolase fold-1 n=1 Tax=Cynara cardunculus var. scolymus TaxID=59895 RepID=A0A103XMC4_CYNCS|nr:Alpha/beta hydrolase fold-1 [Cynara cardunculus var. scolymus]
MATSVLQTVLLVLALLLCISSAEYLTVDSFINHSQSYDGGLCVNLVEPCGYTCSEHTIQTKDGFLLGLQRVSSSIVNLELQSAPPVLLLHGLFMGGDAWFMDSAKQSLGFILPDHGFDVWVGNVRGTKWSHGHVSLSERDKDFWDWSWQELALYDLEAMLRYIKSETSSKVFVVGHSQGTIMSLAAFTQPDIADLVEAAALLSPISYLDHITSKFVLNLVQMHLDEVSFSSLIQIYVNLILEVSYIKIFFTGTWITGNTSIKHEEVFCFPFLLFFSAFTRPRLIIDDIYAVLSDILTNIIDLACDGHVDCSDMLASITGENCCFNSSRVDFYLEYEPHPSSLKNLKHLFQMIRKGTFARYDYGSLKNVLQYGQTKPPSFDLGQIPESLPIWMAHGGNDALGDVIDVHHTLSELPSKPNVLFLENYGHIDFLLSTRAYEDLYGNMIRFFKSCGMSRSS